MRTVSIRYTLFRGAFHVLIGSLLVVMVLLLSRLVASIILTSLTAVLLIFELVRLHVPLINRIFLRWFAPLIRSKEKATLTGSSYFLAGCLITVLVFPSYIAASAILFLSLGDPIAAWIGTSSGGVRFWGKTIEGHLACFSICLISAGLLSVILEDLTFTVALVGAVVATVLQALPLPVNDNFSIPLGSAAAMALTNFISQHL